MNITDQNGINLFLEKPKQGQRCQIKQYGIEGYHSNVIFNNGYFESYKRHENRFEITRWKADLWLPKEHSSATDPQERDEKWW